MHFSSQANTYLNTFVYSLKLWLNSNVSYLTHFVFLNACIMLFKKIFFTISWFQNYLHYVVFGLITSPRNQENRFSAIVVHLAFVTKTTFWVLAGFRLTYDLLVLVRKQMQCIQFHAVRFADWPNLLIWWLVVATTDRQSSEHAVYLTYNGTYVMTNDIDWTKTSLLTL